MTDGLRRWWHSLDHQPQPLQPGEKRAAWLLSIAVALTRLFALAKTAWDWDETLFMSALRHYDVRAHHPHPPGFPLFIATGRILDFAGFSAFHALQAISMLASMAILPAMLLLGRELRVPFRVALASGVLLTFFPNVWFFGGTAFSDVPSMTIVIVAIALLIRGCRSDAALYGGAFVLAVAAGYRPQNLSIGFAPSVVVAIRCMPGRWRQLAGAMAVGAVVIVTAYGAAAHLSGGWSEYSDVVHAHQQYITKVDSFRNPNRPPLSHMFDKFFVRPYRLPPANAFVTLLVAIGTVAAIARLRPPSLLMLAAFGPFCVVAWLVLDRFSVSRFSIGFAPLMAFLAADGLYVVLARRPKLEATAIALFALGVTMWIWPSLSEVRRHPSPPAAAADWIQHNAGPGKATLYVHDSMKPLIDGLLPGFPYVSTGESTPVATATTRENDLFVTEGVASDHGALVFRRPRGRLPALVRERYFEVSVLRLSQIITFVDGWYDEESSGASTWRWMGARARCLLPPVKGRGRLTVQMYIPLDAIKVPPVIELIVNGSVADRFRATESVVVRTIEVPSRDGAPNELLFATDRIVNPAAAGLGGDGRNLGLRLDAIEWSPAR